jgi:hypothetical protein
VEFKGLFFIPENKTQSIIMLGYSEIVTKQCHSARHIQKNKNKRKENS